MAATVRRGQDDRPETPKPQHPGICRMVIYTDYDMRKHPAVVTSVVDLTLEIVNLCVMLDGGGTRWVKDVEHSENEFETTSANSWKWPPRS